MSYPVRFSLAKMDNSGLKPDMSRYPEPSQQQPMPVKKVKSEECYEFLQKVKVEETPGLEHGCKTEILAFQTFIVKEEKWSPVRIKEEEEESNLREYGHSDFSPDSQKVEERPELEPDWTTDMPTSPQLTCKEETYCTVEIKEEMKEETYCTIEIKEEMKEEDCHEDVSFTIQEEKPGIEYDCNAKMYTSPQLTCKEEIKADAYVPEEIKEEEIEEENVREYGHGSSPISHWKFNMVPHGKELSEDLKKRIVALHKDGLGYKKIANTLKLSCSTVAKTIQRFNRTGSIQNRPRHGRPKKLSACAQRHIQRLSLENRRMSAASIAAEVEGVGGQPVSAQTIRRTLRQIGLLSSQKEASSKDDAQKSPQTVC
ncbi:gelsolin-related protein of 125 kDa-like isoform X2 [Alosa alosa]|uniref:gelsolin-related protein of 125 kDa-like isoform X2 n=1 Tax=Alosa alosa TaxID=278164 RepID=UPI0020154C44|nr:gelsolin-related protein of 125 kDa-like isoform X2 [Alosa alosa]